MSEKHNNTNAIYGCKIDDENFFFLDCLDCLKEYALKNNMYDIFKIKEMKLSTGDNLTNSTRKNQISSLEDIVIFEDPNINISNSYIFIYCKNFIVQRLESAGETNYLITELFGELNNDNSIHKFDYRYLGFYKTSSGSLYLALYCFYKTEDNKLSDDYIIITLNESCLYNIIQKLLIISGNCDCFYFKKSKYLIKDNSKKFKLTYKNNRQRLKNK